MDDAVRVVVVDDLVDAANALAMALEIDGYDVRTAHDGREGLRVIEQHRPHCVLLDVNMPDIDGCELSRRLRELYGSDMVLIAISGRNETEARVAETFDRVDHYFRKPFGVAALRTVLPPLTA